MVNKFSVWKFRLGSLDYLSRNPVFSGNFPFGKTKIGLSFTFQPKLPLKNLPASLVCAKLLLAQAKIYKFDFRIRCLVVKSASQISAIEKLY